MNGRREKVRFAISINSRFFFGTRFYKWPEVRTSLQRSNYGACSQNGWRGVGCVWASSRFQASDSFTSFMFLFTFLCNTTPSFFFFPWSVSPTPPFLKSCKCKNKTNKKRTHLLLFSSRKETSLTAKMTDKFLWLCAKVKPKSHQQPGWVLATPLCLEMSAIIS